MKKNLIERIHADIKPIPDFAARPTNYPSVLKVCDLDQIISEIFQKTKNNDAHWKIIRLSLQKNGKN